MSEIKRPARLDITDMPKDKQRSLGGVRQALAASFNYCRRYPEKMAVLKEVLKYVHNRICKWEKEHAEEREAIAKARVEREAAEHGIDLDSRKTAENMRAELNDKLQARKKAAEDAVKPQTGNKQESKSPDEASTSSEGDK